MKGIIGGFIVLIGLMLIIIAFAVPTFSVVNVTQSSSVGAPMENTTASLWYFDTPSPLVKSTSSTETWYVKLPYRIAGGQTFTLNNIGVQISDSQLSQLNGGNGIGGGLELAYYGIDGYLNLTVNNNVLSYGLSPFSHYGTGSLSYTASELAQISFVFSPTFTVPSGVYATSEVLSLTFQITPSLATSGIGITNFNSFSVTEFETNAGQPTNTGVFTSSPDAIPGAYGFIYPMTNMGGYYVYQPANNTWVPLTKTSSITLSYTSFPVTIEFAYVENNGTTTDLGSMYLTMNGNNLAIAQTNQTSIDGYTAYSILIHIASPGTYTINGYLGTTYNTNLQLMSFVYNTASQGGSGQNVTPSGVNYLTLGIGSILILIGGILVWRRK